MNLNYLEYMAAIAKYGSISRAAKALYVSQPYLSSAVKSVEKEMGFQIFQRTGTGVEPTQLGEEWLGGARRILAELQKMYDIGERREQSLKVASYYSPYFMKCFLQAREETGFVPQDSFQEMTIGECYRALKEETANLAVYGFPSCYREQYRETAASFRCSFDELAYDIPLHVMMRKGHPLSKKERISPEELKSYPFVYFNRAAPFLQLLGIEEGKGYMEVSDRGSCLDVLQGSDCLSVIALVSDAPVKGELHYVPFDSPGCEITLACSARADYRLSSREKRFLHIIRAGAAGKVHRNP